MQKNRQWTSALSRSIFLKYTSLRNARWFYGKISKTWKENLYMTIYAEKKISCAIDINNFMCHSGAKWVLDLNFNFKAIIDKYQYFTKLQTYKKQYFKILESTNIPVIVLPTQNILKVLSNSYLIICRLTEK